MHTRLSAWLVLICAPALARNAVKSPQISMEDVAKNQISSVWRKPWSLKSASPANDALTAQEIHEGGFTSDTALRSPESGAEYQVDAAYLYNFAKMARWPSESLPDGAALIIGVLGGDGEFVKVLRDVLVGKDINGHTVEIRYLRSAEEVKPCHLVFFRFAEPINRAIIRRLGSSNVLLVGEDKDFLNDGGMINLTPRDGRVTYEVNIAAFEPDGVRFADTSSPANKNYAQVPDVQPESSRSIAFRVMPEYPRLATALKLAGAVQLQAVVRADGTVKQVKVIGGHPVLAEAAAAAIRRWRYDAGPRETIESVKISFGE
jgi:TonB family protein